MVENFSLKVRISSIPEDCNIIQSSIDENEMNFLERSSGCLAYIILKLEARLGSFLLPKFNTDIYKFTHIKDNDIQSVIAWSRET